MPTRVRVPRAVLQTEGRRLFDEFLRTHGVQEAAVAKALRVSRGAVNNWRKAHAPPDHVYRLAIEKLTDGIVPAAAWATEDEERFVRAIAPICSSHREQRTPEKDKTARGQARL